MTTTHGATRLVAVLLAAGVVALPPVPRRHVVEIRGMTFHPDTLTVQPGDTVVWVNHDIVPHTATSATKFGWTTGQLQRGDSGKYVVRGAGDEPYACQFHPTMVGQIIVR